jgi:hypothetical protein
VFCFAKPEDAKAFASVGSAFCMSEGGGWELGTPWRPSQKQKQVRCWRTMLSKIDAAAAKTGEAAELRMGAFG